MGIGCHPFTISDGYGYLGIHPFAGSEIRVSGVGISQHSEFVQNTPNWPFFERYEVIFYVFYYGTYSYVATTTYVRLPMSDPSDSSQFRVSGGWQWLAPIAIRRMGGYSTYPSTRQNMAPTHDLGIGYTVGRQPWMRSRSEEAGRGSHLSSHTNL